MAVHTIRMGVKNTKSEDIKDLIQVYYRTRMDFDQARTKSVSHSI